MDEAIKSSFVELDELENVSNAITEGRSLAEVLDLIVKRTKQLLEVEQAYIFLKEGAILQLKAASSDFPAEPVIIKPGEGVEGWVLGRGRATTAHSTQPDARFKPFHFFGSNGQEASPAVGIAAVPIRNGPFTVGVLSVIDSTPQSIRVTEVKPEVISALPEMLPFLIVLADLVSLALENSQFLRLQQRRNQLIELLKAISSLGAAKTIEELAQSVVEQISEATGAEKVDIMLHSKETDEFVTLASTNTTLRQLQQKLGLDHIPLGMGGRFLQVYQSGEPFVSGKVTEADQIPLIEQTNIQSLLVVPLQVEQERQGIMSLSSTKPEAFTEDDLSFVKFVTVRLGYALRHEELTQELATAEQARILQDERQNFIAIVAHDLKNTLTAIRGNSQIGLRRAGRGDLSYSEKALQIVTNKANQALQLVNDMVDINQIEQGSFRLFVSPVNLVALLRDEVEAAQPITAKSTIEFFSSLEEMELSIDLNRIAQVFNNLLTNALRYSPDGSIIKVTLESASATDLSSSTKGEANVTLSQAVMVTIADQGIGISRRDQAHIFERFYRGSGAQLAAGSGLGLYISREIITQHGGKLWVESDEGHGSQFHFTLPCDRISSAIPVAPTSS